MNCREAHKLLAAGALGELDRELEASVTAHAQGCAPCRASLEELRGTAALLEAAGDLKPSTERRARAADAMTRAYEEHVLARVRRLVPPWRLRAGVAAAAVVAFSLGVVLAPRESPRAPVMTVETVVGRAFVQGPREARWRELKAGDLLREGDRISGAMDARLVNGGTLATYEGTEAMAVKAVPLELALGDGRLLCRTGAPVSVAGPDGSTLACATGWFEASLRPLPVRPTEGAWTLEQAAEEVEKRTKKKMAVDPGLLEEEVRMAFDPDRYGEQVIKGFEEALPPGIYVFPTSDSSYSVLPEHAERDAGERTLRVQVREGTAMLSGSRGSTEVAAGKESRVTGRGLALAPRRAALPGSGDRRRRSWRSEVVLDEREGLVRFEGLHGVLQQQDRLYWFRVADAAVRLDLKSDRSVAALPMQFEYGRLP